MEMRCASLWVPNMRAPKPMKVGATWISGAATVCETAVIGTAREPPGALLTTVSVPLNGPTVVAVKPTFTVHESPGARFVGQLFTTVNGAAVEMLENVRTAFPPLVSVTSWKTGGLPTTYAGMVIADGICSAAACVPVPAREAVAPGGGPSVRTLEMPRLGARTAGPPAGAGSQTAATVQPEWSAAPSTPATQRRAAGN